MVLSHFVHTSKSWIDYTTGTPQKCVAGDCSKKLRADHSNDFEYDLRHVEGKFWGCMIQRWETQRKVLPWMQNNFADEAYVFQQDGAPCHTARIVQKWMAENMVSWIKDLWPLRIPELNPLDYDIWGIVDARVPATSHRNVTELKAKIVEEWDLLIDDSW